MTNIVNLKEVLALRDDVLQICGALLSSIEKKNKLVSNLELDSKECFFQLHSSNFNRIAEIIEKDDYLIEEINNIDFDISQHINKLCNIYSIKTTDIEKFLRNNPDEEIFKTILYSIKTHRKTMAKLSEEKNKIILELNNEMCNINKEIEELKQLQKIYSKYPEIAEI